MKLSWLWIICVVGFCLSPSFCLAKRSHLLEAKQTESFPLLDEEQNPETKMAKEFMDLICTSNMFTNMGTIGEGSGNLDKSVTYLSKSYLSKITPEKYLESFGNEGDFKLLQLYSANNTGDSNEVPNRKRVFFEISVLVGEEPMNKGLFLGGTPPETTGASARIFYGFITLDEEDGSLKVDDITFDSEFPMGGGHQPYRDSAEYEAQLAMGEDFANDQMDTSNCETKVIHGGRLVYVTCTNQAGDDKKTAKMVYPSGSASGWICIQVLNETLTAGKENPLFAGEKLAKKKQFGKAISEYQKAIDVDANNCRAYELMGYAFFRLKKYDEAIQTLGKSIAVKPDYAMGHYNLALAYWANGQHTEAIEEVQKTIDIDPKYRQEIKMDTQFKDFDSSDDYKRLINP